MYHVPILFLVFNRPDATQVVFDRIREIGPEKLYIGADAPKPGNPDEAKRCDMVKHIVEQVDWPCDVEKLYQTENKGCKIAVSAAIDWFFDHEEAGVILEDDTLPDISFFPFCEELLLKYHDDDRIGHISGNCFLQNAIPEGLSYDFCSITHIWGWATWRRVWKNIDINFPFWEKYKDKRPSLIANLWERIYFSSFIPDAIEHKNGLNPWGVFYYFGLRLQNQLSIYPAVNMVKNIGLSHPFSTHTTPAKNKIEQVLYKNKIKPASSIGFPLHHPEYVLMNKNLNRRAVKYNFFSIKRTIRYIFSVLFGGH